MYPYYTPQYQQIQQPPPQQQQQPQTAVMYASTAKDFANVTIQPGRQALIIAQNEPYMAFKTADMMGMVQTSMYRIEPVTEEQINGPAVEYATKNELAQLQQVVQQIAEAIKKNVEVPAK